MLNKAIETLDTALAAEADARRNLENAREERRAAGTRLESLRATLVAARAESEDYKTRIADLQKRQEALNAPIEELEKQIPPASAKVRSLEARAAALPEEINFWTAAFFHVEVVTEAKILDEMMLNHPENPSLEERAALERQKMKVAALEQHHASMLSQ